jgi:hypothetical protein
MENFQSLDRWLGEFGTHIKCEKKREKNIKYINFVWAFVLWVSHIWKRDRIEFGITPFVHAREMCVSHTALVCREHYVWMLSMALSIFAFITVRKRCRLWRRIKAKNFYIILNFHVKKWHAIEMIKISSIHHTETPRYNVLCISHCEY